jgi:hypothetical protein
MLMLLKKGRPVFAVMALWAVLMALPHPSALAALIPTDAADDARRPSEARELLDRTLAREDVSAELRALGIDPSEARLRVQMLTDAEAAQVAGQIERLPAGGDGLGVAIGILLVVLLVLLILKVTGHLR